MKEKSVVIIGGGISGLAAAHRLMELRKEGAAPAEITVVEAGGRFGGVIETDLVNGFLLEGGPDSFISDKPWALDLCLRLGMAGEIIGTNENHRRSFILKKGKLVPVPEGFYLIAPSRIMPWVFSPLISWPGKLRMACDLFIPPRREPGDESVGAFIRRRLGREALERVGQPMIGGIYSADPDGLSLEATFPRFQEMERRHGSLIRAFRAARAERLHNAAAGSPAGIENRTSGPRYGLFVSLAGGLESLVSGLLKKISPAVNLRASSPVTGLAREGRWKIFLADGGTLEADAVLLAMPAPRQAKLLKAAAPEIGQALSRVRYESVATVNLAFRRQDVSAGLEGFGFVVPAVEKRGIVACTFSSVKYPGRAPDEFVLMRAFAGGAFHPGVFELEDSALTRRALDELGPVLGIRSAPALVSIRRYPEAMPQYRPGHLALIAGIEGGLGRYPGLCLAGNGLRGLGLPDCVRAAEQAAAKVNAYLVSRP